MLGSRRCFQPVAVEQVLIHKDVRVQTSKRQGFDIVQKYARCLKRSLRKRETDDVSAVAALNAGQAVPSNRSVVEVQRKPFSTIVTSDGDHSLNAKSTDELVGLIKQGFQSFRFHRSCSDQMNRLHNDRKQQVRSQ